MKVTSVGSKYGHCNAILARGPFEIGKDFEAPAPAAGFLPRLELDGAHTEVLLAFVDRAKPIANSSPLTGKAREDRLRNGVGEALRWYFYEVHFQPEEKAVRDQLGTFAASIARFRKQLPKETEAVGRFLRDSYTGRAFLRRELQPAAEDFVALTVAWQNRFGIDQMATSLSVMAAYVSAAQQCLGKAKPYKHAPKSLARALASVWSDLTGSWPTSGRDAVTSKQSGPFAAFVRTAIEMLPPKYWPDSLEDPIREACDNPL